MSSFTYEYSAQTKLETFEWDNTWIDHANDTTTRRALYIGDSISCGIRKICTERSAGKWLFDGFGSSKALDHPVFFDSVRLFASQQPRRDVILFNNGLHGWHLDDEREYAPLLEEMLLNLKREYPETPMYVILTTSVANSLEEERVGRRNRAAISIAQKLALPVIDLYCESVRHAALRCADGVHFTKEGYEKFADFILSSIE